jgi:hypothetical protein
MLSVLDQKTIDFVQEYLDSFVVWDLFVYLVNFDDSQPLLASDLAIKLGREIEEVDRGLAFLVEKKVLKRTGGEPEVSYRYVASEEVRANILGFVAALDMREKRLAILTILLGKGN